MEPHGEEFAVGCILSIKTTLEEEFQAQVIAFDRPSNLLILHILQKFSLYEFTCMTIWILLSLIIYLLLLFLDSSLTLDRKIQEGVKSGPVSKRNIRLLKANYVKEFNFLGRGEDPLDPDKCFLDLNTLQAREDSAIR